MFVKFIKSISNICKGKNYYFKIINTAKYFKLHKRILTNMQD